MQPALQLAAKLPHPTKYEEWCKGSTEFTQHRLDLAAAARAFLGPWLLLATGPRDDMDHLAAQDIEVALEQSHQSLLRYRQEVLERWHQEVALRGHTRPAAASENHFQAFDQGLESHLQRLFSEDQARERLRRIFQARRDSRGAAGAKESITADSEQKYDPEHFDDAELFYRLMQQRLAEANWERSISFVSRPSAAVAALVQDGAIDPATALVMERARHRLRKYAPEERRASKGRRLLYATRERLVGFMAPRPLPRVRPLPGPLPMEI
jgi:exonuclease VII large subunit